MTLNLPIIGILTVGLTLATILGYLTQRWKISSILGYLLAGYLIGPYSPGYVADSGLSEQLAEIGVILMLFGVGMHFKIEDLLRVKKIAITGAVGQTLAATLFATLIVHMMGWVWSAGLIIGLSIGVASTVVLVRVLTDNHILNTPRGHIAVGWLVVEDIFTVIILILLPSIAQFATKGDITWSNIATSIFWVIGKFFVLALFMFTWGQKAVLFILTRVARLRFHELFTLTVLTLVFLIAIGASFFFGTSIALGAFIAGMVIGRTHVKHQAASNALPLKDIFSVIFFLSVGMLFNPEAIVNHFTLFIGILGVIIIIKPLVAYLITLLFGYPIYVALTIALSLAQIGEFSFILAEEAMNLNLIPDDGFDILVACALISISLNPLLFKGFNFFESLLHKLHLVKKRQHRHIKLTKEKNDLPKVVVVGFGALGAEIAKILKNSGFAPIIIENNIDLVTESKDHHPIIFGDAMEANLLKAAKIEEAIHLLITPSNTAAALKIIHIARDLNPEIHIMARMERKDEKASFDSLKVKYVCAEDEVHDAFLSLMHRILKTNPI